MKDDVAIIPASQANDDDLWAPLDMGNNQDGLTGALGNIAEEELSPEELAEAGFVQDDEEFEDPVPASVVSQQPQVDDELTDEQPDVIDIEGGTVTISHDKQGWHGVLEIEDGGGKEVFHGKTQRELMTNVLAGKLNATRQIRKLNKKLKLGTPVPDATPATSVEPASRQLDANDIFEIKAALDADPSKAFDLFFQKRFNLTAEQLVQLAKRGAEAHEELTVESVSKEFLEAHADDYYPWDENGYNMMAWLVKNKLRRPLKSTDNFGNISAELLAKGLYSVEALEEAFEDLQDSGLLKAPPSEEVEEIEEAVVPAAVTPAAPTPRRQPPAPPNPRIASTRRRPRATFGIRPGSVSSNQPTPEVNRVPSVEDLDNLSDTDLQGLWNGVRRTAITRGRR